VDGAVTFHELAPELTRIVLVLEYRPRGVVERVGNLWRAQGRRARLELKHFQRHCMAETILHADEIKGWRGEIRDGEVVEDHAAAVEEDQDDEYDYDDDRDDEYNDARSHEEQEDEDEPEPEPRRTRAPRRPTRARTR